MGLWARMSPGAEDRIGVNRLASSVGEHLRGELTAQQVRNVFTLSPQEQNELNSILTRILNGDISPQHVKDVFMLVELGDYLEVKAKSSLGY
jgi:hypothetical protein